VFSVEPNAENAAAQLRGAGIPTSVVAQDAGGRVVWLVVSSPAEDDADADATLARIKEAGFIDAVLIEADS
jgi:cell division protein FtsN